MSLTTSRIISTEELHAAVSAIPKTVPAWQGEEGPRLELTVAPGVIRLSRRDRNRAELAAERRWMERGKEVRTLRDSALYPGGMTGEKRQTITKFTRQSRARMVRVLCELDYAPLFAGGDRPAMITLTLPGAWEQIAPSVKAYKAIIDRFRKAYKYAWGTEMVGVWKNEYQKRGAPHLHMLTTPPNGLARGTGEPFQDWLGRAWAGACQTSLILGEEEAGKHVRAGTGIDYDRRGQWADAKRIAIYYAKHGLFGAKEYQNQPPELWVEQGSVGRFWGYWGLKKGGSSIELDMRSVRHEKHPAEKVAEVVQKCRDAGIPVSMNLLRHVENRIITQWGHRLEPGDRAAMSRLHRRV